MVRPIAAAPPCPTRPVTVRSTRSVRAACAALAVVATLATLPAPLAAQRSPRRAARPNIVLIFPDNLGWGEVGAYGSVRGVPTPHIDSIAAQGARLDNFNVEFSCTVSRAAMMT